MLKVSKWTIYKLIELDPKFPAHNVGVKKKFVIDPKKLTEWAESKARRRVLEKQGLQTGEDLLKLIGVSNA